MANGTEGAALAARVGGLLSSGGLLERGEAMRAALLALAAGESVFLYGPPGTAKTMLASWAAGVLGGARPFSCLLSQYTQPDELFGPVSIERLGEGERVVLTEGYLPSAEVAFLDEVFKAGPAILNTLLTILNERTFRNGREVQRVPLRLLVGASNELPDDDAGLDALYDRFLLRVEVRPVQRRESFDALLSAPAEAPAPAEPLTAAELESWRAGAAAVSIPQEISAYLFSLRLRLAERGIYVSDRRWAKCGGLLRASAFLNGRAAAAFPDLLVLGNALWSRPSERTDVAECARDAVTSEAVLGGFQFTSRISREAEEMESREIPDEAAYTKLSADADRSLDYLRRLSAELEGAREGGAAFWRNALATLDTPFERALMGAAVDRLREFAAESERRVAAARFSRRPKVREALDAAAPTVILRAADEALSAATRAAAAADAAANADDSEAIAALLRPQPQTSRLAAFGSALRGLFPGGSARPEPQPQPPRPAPRQGGIDLTPRSAAPGPEPGETPAEPQPEGGRGWEETLSQIDTFEEFVRLGGVPFRGDAGDPRYRWNDNRNNGERWWNVGSRFTRCIEDRADTAAIEAECARRGAGVGGRFHWVYAVCHIFEKNDGRFDARTRAELSWLTGSAWRILEPALEEALS
jgi:MoxR-like ATPase